MLQEEAALKCLPAKPCTTLNLSIFSSLFFGFIVFYLHSVARPASPPPPPPCCGGKQLPLSTTMMARASTYRTEGTCVCVPYWVTRAPTHIKTLSVCGSNYFTSLSFYKAMGFFGERDILFSHSHCSVHHCAPTTDNFTPRSAVVACERQQAVCARLRILFSCAPPSHP